MRWSLPLLLAFVAGVATGQTVADSANNRLRELEEKVARLRQEVLALRAQLAQPPEASQGAPAASLSDVALSKRLNELENAVAKVLEELENLKEHSGDVEERINILDLTESRRPVIASYGHFVAKNFENQNSIFDAEAFELVVSAQPHARISLFAELEFERAAAVGGSRGGEIVTEQAHVTFDVWEGLSVRAGALLVPFGNVNIDHYAPRRDVVSRPLVAYVVTPGDWTDNGVGILGQMNLGKNWSFGYEVDIVAGLNSEISALGLRAARQRFGVDNNQNKATVARMDVRYSGNLVVGNSFYIGKYDDQSQLPLKGYAVDSTFKIGILSLTGEYDRFEADREIGPKAVFEGGYVRGTLMLSEHMFGSGRLAEIFPNASVGLVGQWDWASIVGPYGEAWVTNEERRVTWGLVARPTDHFVVKVNYEKNEANNMPLYRGNKRGWLTAVGFVF